MYVWVAAPLKVAPERVTLALAPSPKAIDIAPVSATEAQTLKPNPTLTVPVKSESKPKQVSGER